MSDERIGTHYLGDNCPGGHEGDATLNSEEDLKAARAFIDNEALAYPGEHLLTRLARFRAQAREAAEERARHERELLRRAFERELGALQRRAEQAEKERDEARAALDAVRRVKDQILETLRMADQATANASAAGQKWMERAEAAEARVRDLRAALELEHATYLLAIKSKHGSAPMAGCDVCALLARTETSKAIVEPAENASNRKE